ncbi:MAG: hypothetical protein E7311_06825 [Clostridiales bacterium]|nr:hypothetical protein [Clostridiales bacterium]
MYNKILKRLYQEYKTKEMFNGKINFLNDNNKVVASLYPSTQLLNIFLSASKDVVWNHNGYAIFVIAKHWQMKTNGYLHNVEAAWLIGMCGSTLGKNLVNNRMFLESADWLRSEGGSLIGYAPLAKINPTGTKRVVKFNIFDYEITYSFAPEEEWYIYNLNPALIYPIKTRGKKDKKSEGVRYLRKRYKWEYNEGYDTAGSYQTREFIEKIAPRDNHGQLSQIDYFRVVIN